MSAEQVASPAANARGLRDARSALAASRRPLPDRPAPCGTLRSLAIACGALGLNRDASIGFATAVAGRRVKSRKQLTAREASAVLDRLEEITPRTPSQKER